MIDSNEIKVEGFYEFFPNDILASTEEEVQIKREMTEKLIMKLVFRLDSIMSKIN
jgi:outer membrane lipopolysaccharide assembly protein LptE/RlpB